MVSRRLKFALWWRQGGTWWRFGLAGLILLSLVMLLTWEGPSDESAQQGSNFVVFLLVNLNIIILCLLAFVIGRNVVKLIFDRRRNILGSKLRLRLVLAFVGLALIPSTILFLFANGLLTTVMEGWFSSHVEEAVSGSVDVARLYHRSLIETARTGSQGIAAEVEKQERQTADELTRFLERRRERYAFFTLQIVNAESRTVASAESAANIIENFREPELKEDALQRARNGKISVLTERRQASQFIRSYLPVKVDRKPMVLVTTVRIDPELTRAIESVNDSYREYEQLKLFKNRLKSGYVLSLAMITGLILFAAIWIGFYIARDISVPIQRIAEGTQQVARGNYDFHIRAAGSDELAFLAQSFNQMTRDLKGSRDEGERRRLFIETILENLAVGVIAMDRDRVISSINDAAARLLGMKDSAAVIGRPIEDTMSAEYLEQLDPLFYSSEQLREFDAEEDEDSEKQRRLTLRAEGSERQVVCTVGVITDTAAKRIGTVLLLDDITELSKAQQMSAWREVARRIAHEIKNPLTPIQLSAQRLEKLVAQGESSDTVRDCAETIVQNVDSIKRLANEFSHFARMPTAQFQPASLNGIIAESVASFAANHSAIVFQFLPDDKLPLVLLDREQIRRLMINLLDNSISVFDEPQKDIEAPRIVIKTNYDRKRKVAMVELSDNGPGIPDLIKGRIFDPYFTTKKGGTGLGLAIVTSIVNDHQGQIRVYDNHPRGAKFLIELALTPTILPQRRFANPTEDPST